MNCSNCNRKLECPRCGHDYKSPWHRKAMIGTWVLILVWAVRWPVLNFLDREVWNPPNSYVAQTLLDSVENDPAWELKEYSKLKSGAKKIVLVRRGLERGKIVCDSGALAITSGDDESMERLLSYREEQRLYHLVKRKAEDWQERKLIAITEDH